MSQRGNYGRNHTIKPSPEALRLEKCDFCGPRGDSFESCVGEDGYQHLVTFLLCTPCMQHLKDSFGATRMLCKAKRDQLNAEKSDVVGAAAPHSSG